MPQKDCRARGQKLNLEGDYRTAGQEEVHTARIKMFPELSQRPLSPSNGNTLLPQKEGSAVSTKAWVHTELVPSW